MTSPAVERTKILIAASHGDAEWLAPLHAHLAALCPAEVLIVLDEQPGDGRRDLGEVVDYVRAAVLLISPAFFTVPTLTDTLLPALFTAAQRDGVVLLPIIVAPCRLAQAAVLAPYPPVNDFTHPLDAMNDLERERLWARVAAEVQGALSTTLIPGQGTGPISLPPRARVFAGRDAILHRLRETLTHHRLVLLHGPHGIGKTATVAEYAVRYRPTYQTILWVPADDALTLRLGLLRLGALLGLPGCETTDPAGTLHAVTRWLSHHDDWLLILEDVGALDLLHPFVPPTPRGHVVLTASTAPAVGPGQPRAIALPPLTPEEGLHLLRARTLHPIFTPVERAAAQALVRELGGVPLALALVGAYLVARQTSLADYLPQFTARHGTRLPRTGPHPAVVTAVRMALAALEHATPAALEVLHASAFLAPAPIPDAVVCEGAASFGAATAAALSDVGHVPTLLDEVLDPPACFGLLQRDEGDASFRLHAMVAESVRMLLPAEDRRRWAERAVRALDRTFPSPTGAHRGACIALLPHVMAATHLVEEWSLASTPVGSLLNNAALVLKRGGCDMPAERCYRLALSVQEQALGPHHPAVATLLNNLGRLEKEMGHYEEAEELYRRALFIQAEANGPEHPAVAAVLNNLGALQHARGHHEEALRLHQEALVLREQVLGTDHLDVAQSLNNMASALMALRRYQAAEPLLERAIDLRARHLGARHPEVAILQCQLARALTAQERHAEAEPLLLQALESYEESEGPVHKDVARTLNQLGVLYECQGESAMAEASFLRALAAIEKSAGPEHPDVAATLDDLAELYAEENLFEEAEILLRRGLSILETAYGVAHPAVAHLLDHLAWLYAVQGEYANAEPLYTRALAITERCQGADHPDVAHSLSNLAGMYTAQGKLAYAEPLLERALAIIERSVGTDHPDLPSRLADLAVLHVEQGKYVEAEHLYGRALALRERALGPTHPHIAADLNNLATVCLARRDYARTESLLQRALAIEERTLGPDHPEIAGYLNNLATVCHAQRRYAEAQLLASRALAIREKTLGPDHPEVAATLDLLATLLRKQRRRDEANALTARAHAIRGDGR